MLNWNVCAYLLLAKGNCWHKTCLLFYPSGLNYVCYLRFFYGCFLVIDHLLLWKIYFSMLKNINLVIWI